MNRAQLVAEVAALAPGREKAFLRWCKAFLHWTPHAKQESFGQSIAKTILLMCGIRFGKSDVAAARFLFHMFFTPNGKFLNASFSQDQAEIVVRKAYDIAMAGPLRGFVEPLRISPYLTLRLKNGATLQARSTSDANLLRGKTYHGINVDEGAFCSWADFEVLMGRVIDYDGWLSVTSSPPPLKGPLFALWVRVQTAQMQGDPRAYAETGSTYDNPHMPVHRIKDLEAAYTEQGAQREIYGQFVDNEGSTFPLAIVDPAYGEYPIETAPIQNGSYVSAFDLARKKAMFAGITLECSGPQMREVWHTRGSGVPWEVQCRTIEAQQAFWSSSAVIDGTGVGDVVDGMLDIAVTPFIFTAKSRAQGIILLQKVFQTGMIRLDARHAELRTQLNLHTWKEDAEGITWDDFDALLMAVWKANRMNATLGFSVIG